MQIDNTNNNNNADHAMDGTEARPTPQLPIEMWVAILSFCPTSIRRFLRSVCKDWHSLLPTFSSLPRPPGLQVPTLSHRQWMKILAKEGCHNLMEVACEWRSVDPTTLYSRSNIRAAMKQGHVDTFLYLLRKRKERKPATDRDTKSFVVGCIRAFPSAKPFLPFFPEVGVHKDLTIHEFWVTLEAKSLVPATATEWTRYADNLSEILQSEHTRDLYSGWLRSASSSADIRWKYVSTALKVCGRCGSTKLFDWVWNALLIPYKLTTLHPLFMNLFVEAIGHDRVRFVEHVASNYVHPYDVLYYYSNQATDYLARQASQAMLEIVFSRYGGLDGMIKDGRVAVLSINVNDALNNRRTGVSIIRAMCKYRRVPDAVLNWDGLYGPDVPTWVWDNFWALWQEMGACDCTRPLVVDQRQRKRILKCMALHGSIERMEQVLQVTSAMDGVSLRDGLLWCTRKGNFIGELVRRGHTHVLEWMVARLQAPIAMSANHRMSCFAAAAYEGNQRALHFLTNSNHLIRYEKLPLDDAVGTTAPTDQGTTRFIQGMYKDAYCGRHGLVCSWLLQRFQWLEDYFNKPPIKN